jgi:hypothetical protein
MATLDTYNLSDGSTVRTFQIGDDTEFVTSNPAGDVISTARLSGVHASNVLRTLRHADALTAYHGATTIRLTGSRTTPARFLN